jgi:short-subunit dehydrogenase involved in D-alanine esterification of teichoic acids
VKTVPELPELPELIDNAGIQRELNVKRAAADAIMRELPKVKIPGLDKTYVYRRDVDELIRNNTIDVVTVRARRRRAA